MTLIDYICIALLLIFVIVAAVKGFAKIILHFFAYVAVGIASRYSAGPVSDFVYDKYVSKSIHAKLAELIPSGSIGASLEEVMNAVRASLSESAYNIASFLHLLPEEGRFSDSVLTVEAIENNYIQPIVTKVLVIVTTIVLFMILMIIISIIINASDKRLFKDKKNAVSTANRVLGGVVGLAQGIIPVGGICLLMNVLAPVIENDAFSDLVSNSLFCTTIAELFR